MAFLKTNLTPYSAVASIGAGFASAILTMLLSRQSGAGALLGVLAPLPIMIAAMGFGPVPGLLSVAVGAALVGLVDVKPAGVAFLDLDKPLSAGIDVLTFLIGLGLPSWALARLAVRPLGAPTAPMVAPGRLRPEERFLGAIILAAAGVALLSFAIDLAVILAKEGGYDAYVAKDAKVLVDAVQKAMKDMPSAKDMTMTDAQLHPYAIFAIWLRWAILAAQGVVLFVVNLWTAARIAMASHLMAPSRLDIARHVRLPRFAALLFAAALGLTFAGGRIGLAGLIVSAVLLMVFALQGLAVVHALSRGKTYRTPLLILVYLCMVLPFGFALFGALGLLDELLSFRDRQTSVVEKPTGPWSNPRN